MDDLQAAWDELHDVVPASWVVGRPMLARTRTSGEQYAYRPSERHHAGMRKDEWLATATTEAGCVAEMARCLGEIREAYLRGRIRIEEELRTVILASPEVVPIPPVADPPTAPTAAQGDET